MIENQICTSQFAPTENANWFIIEETCQSADSMSDLSVLKQGSKLFSPQLWTQSLNTWLIPCWGLMWAAHTQRCIHRQKKVKSTTSVIQKQQIVEEKTKCYQFKPYGPEEWFYYDDISSPVHLSTQLLIQPRRHQTADGFSFFLSLSLSFLQIVSCFCVEWAVHLKPPSTSFLTQSLRASPAPDLIPSCSVTSPCHSLSHLFPSPVSRSQWQWLLIHTSEVKNYCH